MRCLFAHKGYLSNRVAGSSCCALALFSQAKKQTIPCLSGDRCALSNHFNFSCLHLKKYLQLNLLAVAYLVSCEASNLSENMWSLTTCDTHDLAEMAGSELHRQLILPKRAFDLVCDTIGTFGMVCIIMDCSLNRLRISESPESWSRDQG